MIILCAGVHLQPSKNVKREVNNDETPSLDCPEDSSLFEVFARTFSFVTISTLDASKGEEEATG